MKIFRYLFLLLILIPLTAIAQTGSDSVEISFSWDPVTKSVDGSNATDILKNYKLYGCTSAIDDLGKCDGKLQIFETIDVDDKGFLKGQDFSTKPLVISTQAEDFDAGKEGVTWHDSTVGNVYKDDHPLYRLDSTDVDVRCYPWLTCKNEGGPLRGYQIGSSEEGEWQQYTVTVPKEGVYTPVVSIANGSNEEATLTMSVRNPSDEDTHKSKIVTFSVEGNGDWDYKKQISGEPVTLVSGIPYVFRFKNTVGAVDFDWWELREEQVVFFSINYEIDKFPIIKTDKHPIYFRVTSVGKDGKESDFSNQVTLDLSDVADIPVTTPNPPVLRWLED